MGREGASAQMAFVSTLVRSEFHPSAFRLENGAKVSFLIGYDDEEDITYTMWVSLCDDLIGHELIFFITEDHGSGRQQNLFSGQTFARIASRAERDLIMEKLLITFDGLLNFVKPPRVHMCTMDVDLPEKALFKYVMLCKVAEDSGYRIEAYDPYNGQRMWNMIKLDTVTTSPSRR